MRPRAGTALALVVGGFALTANPASAQRFSLGTGQSFAGLGSQSATNTGVTVLTGDLGVSPGTSITGAPTVTGTIHSADAIALQARTDLITSYNALAALTPTQALTGLDLGNVSSIVNPLKAGVYFFSSSAQLTGTLYLDTQGNPDSLFVFQIGSTLTTASNSSVVMVGGAAACNVFWQVGSSATLGTETNFNGSILAAESVTLTTGADILSGRALALGQNGSLTMDTNTITLGVCPPLTEAAGTFAAVTPSAGAAPEPGSLALLLPVLGTMGIVIRTRRHASRPFAS